MFFSWIVQCFKSPKFPQKTRFSASLAKCETLAALGLHPCIAPALLPADGAWQGHRHNSAGSLGAWLREGSRSVRPKEKGALVMGPLREHLARAAPRCCVC